jgi:hypothetical protein
MVALISTELYRIGIVASDVGLVDWVKTIAMSGALAALLRAGLGRLARVTRHGWAS